MERFDARDYEQAKKIIDQLMKENPNDNVAKYYAGLLDKYFLQGLYPQEKDNEGVEFTPQDGVFKLLQK